MPPPENTYPWFPVEADWALLQEPADLSLEALGLLVKLVSIQWKLGGLPRDFAEISKRCSVDVRKIRRLFESELHRFFVENPDNPNQLINLQYDDVYRKKREVSRVKAEAGAKGGKAGRKQEAYAKGVEESRVEESRGSGTTSPPSVGSQNGQQTTLLMSPPPETKAKRPAWVHPVSQHVSRRIGSVSPTTVLKHGNHLAQAISEWPEEHGPYDVGKLICQAVDSYRRDTEPRYMSVKSMWTKLGAYLDGLRPGSGLE